MSAPCPIGPGDMLVVSEEDAPEGGPPRSHLAMVVRSGEFGVSVREPEGPDRLIGFEDLREAFARGFLVWIPAARRLGPRAC